MKNFRQLVLIALVVSGTCALTGLSEAKPPQEGGQSKGNSASFDPDRTQANEKASFMREAEDWGKSKAPGKANEHAAFNNDGDSDSEE